MPAFLIAVLVLSDIRDLLTPAGSWMVVLLFSHLAVLTIACVIPQRETAVGLVDERVGEEGQAFA